jgi:hypothetical protein
VNHTISTLLAAFAVLTAVASSVFGTGEPAQKVGAVGGCITDNYNNNSTSTCLYKHTNISNNTIDILFLQSIDSKNNSTKPNPVTALQKDIPFVLPFP